MNPPHTLVSAASVVLVIIHHAFAIHSMMDEIAEARGMDPIEILTTFRRGQGFELLKEEMERKFENYGEKIRGLSIGYRRMKKVIEEVAQKSNLESSQRCRESHWFCSS